MDLNLNKEFNNILLNIDINNKPNLFLHVCCAPCSSSVLERLNKHFKLYIIYYNPNIDTKFEFEKRLKELHKLIKILNYDIDIIYENYQHTEFLNYINGFENEPEGGKRCEKCFELRLKQSYDIALNFIKNHNMENSVNYLVSTLSVSPHKNSLLIYKIGNEICYNTIIRYLPSDFKKEDGYLRSIRLSKKYNLYRQNYCGCEFAKNE